MGTLDAAVAEIEDEQPDRQGQRDDGESEQNGGRITGHGPGGASSRPVRATPTSSCVRSAAFRMAPCSSHHPPAIPTTGTFATPRAITLPRGRSSNSDETAPNRRARRHSVRIGPWGDPSALVPASGGPEYAASRCSSGSAEESAEECAGSSRAN